MADYPNIRLAVELLLIESGLQGDEDTSAQVSARIDNVINNLRSRFSHFDLEIAEQWLGYLAYDSYEFAQHVRGQLPLPKTTERIMIYVRSQTCILR